MHQECKNFCLSVTIFAKRIFFRKFPKIFNLKIYLARNNTENFFSHFLWFSTSAFGGFRVFSFSIFDQKIIFVTHPDVRERVLQVHRAWHFCIFLKTRQIKWIIFRNIVYFLRGAVNSLIFSVSFKLCIGRSNAVIRKQLCISA